MTTDTEILKKRFIELGKKSYSADIFTFTDFLGLAEQSAFSEIKKELRGLRSFFKLLTGIEPVTSTLPR